MWTPERVLALMANNDTELCKCVVAIYKRQTKSEQEQYATGVWNGVGFNKFDAKILTSFAKQILANRRKGNARLLSPKQIEVARRKMTKYAKQLAKIANGEI